MSEKRFWVWLSMVFGGGNHRLWKLASRFETAEEICSLLMSGGGLRGLNENEKRNIQAYSLKNADDLITECSKKGIGILTYSDDEYPNQLKYICDPPPVLYYKGDIGVLSGTKTITAVGTRHAGSYSLSVCRRICSELAKQGFIIVSGFAVGSDITAHMAAANFGFPTVCVLGCGVDVDYPKENFSCRDIILSAGGVFVSEYPPGTRPNRVNFPKRNRILAAIGRATLVFEAPQNSGSLITADLALEQGRDVFVLPPADIFSSAFSGNIQFLREGAAPLMSVEDITDFFSAGSSAEAYVKSDAFAYIIGNSDSFKDAEIRLPLFAVADEAKTDIIPENTASKENVKNKNTALKNNSQSVVKENKYNDIPQGLQRDIVELLMKEGSLHSDVIGMKLEADITVLLNELTELELIGAVRQKDGRIYELI